MSVLAPALDAPARVYPPKPKFGRIRTNNAKRRGGVPGRQLITFGAASHTFGQERKTVVMAIDSRTVAFRTKTGGARIRELLSKRSPEGGRIDDRNTDDFNLGRRSMTCVER